MPEQIEPYDAERLAKRLDPNTGTMRRVYAETPEGDTFEVIGVRLELVTPLHKELAEDAYLVLRHLTADATEDEGETVTTEVAE